jgi:hypothetical protein
MQQHVGGCNSKVTIWSYSMEAHYATAHPGVTIPPSLKAQVSLRYHEEAYLRRDRLSKSKTKFSTLCRQPVAQCECKAYDKN